MRLPNNRNAVLTLIVCAFGFGGIWFHPLTWACVASFVCFMGIVAFDHFNYRAGAKRWLEKARVNPIVLRSPFEDRWYVAAGGPDPRHNHHTVVTDQVYAYDFLRQNGQSWDQPVLAPCDGMVVHVESREEDAPPDERRRNLKRPFGNYVSIETLGGYVLLAHLKQGSVLVRVGDTVRAGTAIGRCGNSGNTRGAHLHVHAQNQPSQSIDVAEGIPIAFIQTPGSKAMILEYLDTVG